MATGPIALASRLGLAAASLLTFLVLAETCASVLDAMRDSPLPIGVSDPVLGNRLRPNHEGELEGVAFRTNRHGLRWDEVSPEPPSGGFRILAVGDSSTFGFAVEREDSYPARLERRLSERFPDCSIEVINAGTPGWQTGNGAAFLSHEGLAWKPDLVLVNLGYNDRLDGRFHYDYDAATRTVWTHRVGSTERQKGSHVYLFQEVLPTGFWARFDDFPTRLMLAVQMKRLEVKVNKGVQWIGGVAKSSGLASLMLRRIYQSDPDRIYDRLRQDVEGNHVVESYATHLSQMIDESRAADTPVAVVLQPRRAHREFLDFLPEPVRSANLAAIADIRRGEPEKAVGSLERLHEERSHDAITIFNLSVAYRRMGRNDLADAALAKIASIRPFAMNAVADRVAAGQSVAVVYTPIAFQEHEETDHFMIDRYHTLPSGYAIVAQEVERVLVEDVLRPGVCPST